MTKAIIGLTALLISCANQDIPQPPKNPKQYHTLEEKKELAQCLVKQEATMYGAWWCDSCEKQKD